MRHFDPDDVWTDQPQFDPYHRPETSNRLRAELLRRYEGMSLNQVLPGRAVHNDHGSCHRISGLERGALVRCTRARARTDLHSALELVPGIRDRMHERLADEGYQSLNDLQDHPRFGGDSTRICELLSTGDTGGLMDLLAERLSSSDPLVLRLAGFYRDTEFAFLDLETMGLFGGQPVVLAGIARPSRPNTIRFDQFLARDFPDEAALVAEVCRILDRTKVLVTYNGRSFDVPFLEQRAAYYGIAFPGIPVHFDLLHFCRRTWKHELNSCSLRSIEQNVLRLTRDEDLPGELVPEFYQDFLRTRNPGLLKPIVEHNRQDIISLVSVFSSLVQHWFEDTE